MKISKRICALALAFIVVFGAASPVFASEEVSQTESAASDAAKWLKLRNWNPKATENWLVLSLVRSGTCDPFSIRMQSYQTNIETYINRNTYFKDDDGKIDYIMYPLTAVSVTAVGKVATLFTNFDFIMGSSLQYGLDTADASAWPYALIAVDTAGYEFSEGGDMTREVAIERLLAWQQEDGSFSDDAQLTAICLQALSRYTQEEEVALAVESALAYLTDELGGERGFVNDDAPVITSAQVVIALCELGLNPYEFAGGELLNFIMDHQNSNGSFSPEIGEKKDEDTTVWALLALTAYNRAYLWDMTTLFDLTDVYGMTHNQLSPFNQMGIKVSLVVLMLVTFSIVAVGIRGILRQRKWAKQGILNEKGLKMSEREIAARDGDEEARRELAEAKARLEEQRRIAKEIGNERIVDPNVQSAKNEIVLAKARLQAQYGVEKPVQPKEETEDEQEDDY